MKSRRVSQFEDKALHDFNPKLAKALIDDRDEVTETLHQCSYRMLLQTPLGWKRVPLCHTLLQFATNCSKIPDVTPL